MVSTIIHVSDLDGRNGFRLDGDGFNQLVGYSVSDAGDVNGDGFDDVIIGNYGDSGSSFVVFGGNSEFDSKINLSGLDGENGFHLGSAGDMNGRAVSTAGDINGDGLDDVVVNGTFYDPNKYSAHFSYDENYVVFGKDSGFDADVSLLRLNGENGFKFGNKDVQGHSRMNISTAGDVNGDGFDDVIVGAWAMDSNGRNSGSSYVVFGKSSGFNSCINLLDLNGSNGFRLDGENAEDESGTVVSSAGDINGDGFDDLVIGAGHTDFNGEESGSSYVVFGRASGFEPSMNLSELDGNSGFRLDGENAGDFSGWSVSSAGDVNGDGFSDLIIAAGISAYVVFGRASGFAANLNLSSLDGSNGFRLDGSVGLVSSAGDVNGDGFDDVMVGGNGSSYVIFGKATGFGSEIVLSDLKAKDGFRLDGEDANDLFGFSVSGAGDVNGDGFDDVIVGAPQASANGGYSGSCYVIFGRSDFGSGEIELPEIKGTDGDDTLKGSTEAEHFIAGDGNDSLLGLGGADVFDAGAGDDAIRIGDLTFASIDGGDGNDALHLAGANLNLDLTTLGSNIHGIETICLYGRGDNTLTLNADSLLNLSDSTNTLKVHGNSGDHIVVQGADWVDGGGSGFYHTYTHDDAVLLVGANVTVELV